MIALGSFHVSFVVSHISRAFPDGAASVFVISGVFLVFPLNGNVFVLLHVAVGKPWQPLAIINNLRRLGLLSEAHPIVLLQVVARDDPSILEQSFPTKVALVELPDSGVLERVQFGALVEEGEVAARNVPTELLPRARCVTAPDASEPALVVVHVVDVDSVHRVVVHEAVLFVLLPRVEADQIVVLK